MRTQLDTPRWYSVVWVLVAWFVLFTASWTGMWFYQIIQKEANERVKLIYEGDAEWVPVMNIENENIILKKKLDDLQVHYDSMICYRPHNAIGE